MESTLGSFRSGCTVSPSSPGRVFATEAMERTLAGRLEGVACSIARGELDRADRDLQGLLSEAARDADPRAVNLCVFGAALARRIAGASEQEANLYLQRHELPQIQLFDLLATAAPFVGLAGVIANAEIVRACAGEACPTLVDVGIGTGRQVVALLQAMAREGTLPRSLTVVGVEPSASSLELAQRNVAAAAKAVGTEVAFHGFHAAAESLMPADWRAVRAACTSRPVVNASFALHHVADVGGRDVRDDVLRRLRGLRPKLLVLSEPDVHHLERDFLRRFRNCWEHFSAAFDAIDATGADRRDKAALKACFFGREIADILAAPEPLRSERHESTASWLARLASTGWESDFRGALPPSRDGVTPRRRPGRASLEFGGTPLVSVMCAVPA